MKLTILADNNTSIDKYYLGEPAFCVYVEAYGQKILFDTGYSDVFLQMQKKQELTLVRPDTLSCLTDITTIQGG